MTDDSSPATGITANPPSGELGRMLLERRVPISGAVTLGFMAIGMLAVGVVSALIYDPRHPQQRLLAIPFTLIGALMAVATYAFWIGRLRCHENGVRKIGLAGTTTLPYEEVESFSYNSNPVHQFGVYSGTLIVFRLVPRREVQKPVIVLSMFVKKADEGLEGVVAKLTRIVAARLRQTLAAGQLVRWTNRMGCHPEGLEYQPSAFSRKSEILDYREVERIETAPEFVLYRKGDAKPALRMILLNEPNYLPGLAVFREWTGLSDDGA